MFNKIKNTLNNKHILQIFKHLQKFQKKQIHVKRDKNHILHVKYSKDC